MKKNPFGLKVDLTLKVVKCTTFEPSQLLISQGEIGEIPDRSIPQPPGGPPPTLQLGEGLTSGGTGQSCAGRATQASQSCARTR